MYTLPVILFCTGILSGGIHAYFWGQSFFDWLFAIAVGGFLGSALGAAAFIYKYAAREKAHKREKHNGLNTLAGAPGPAPKALTDRSRSKKLSPLPGETSPLETFLEKNSGNPTRAEKIQQLEKELNALKQKREKGN
ncbi:hypothetical protein SAMN02746065_11618 [Desulfocicer vacuolatum DSM 3385]|uniref:Uncharacterized protein n=1 Tax=Desulfocicer vacuolatum DSM 3385 TaxID=1121400 RepID=A0A1W2D8K0_9BACT|nr:hypothetical protein [Desulfocicer vacuolatum]SMC93847.1 hypothetical protein SAMN02746065_11618 [Desulfocicer vacuolatum DSM 3385]